VTAPEPRPPIPAKALEWVTLITTVGLEFALPPLLGGVLDRWWKTSPGFTIAGAVLGFATGMIHLFQIARERPGP
jgi:ATP synthase protein I